MEVMDDGECKDGAEKELSNSSKVVGYLLMEVMDDAAATRWLVS